MTFSSTDGTTVTYTYSSRTDSEPYTGYATGSQDESTIICHMESARVLTLNNGNAGIRLRFQQIEHLNQPIEKLEIAFNDVVSVTRIDPDQPPYSLDPDKQFRVKRIVFARQAGLVGMELENGQFFTLVR